MIMLRQKGLSLFVQFLYRTEAKATFNTNYFVCDYVTSKRVVPICQKGLSLFVKNAQQKLCIFICVTSRKNFAKQRSLCQQSETS